MLGQTISHYRITSQLGVGGMGVVYAAEDPRLNRQVALKFVPEELAHDTHALERLRSEARTASGLNHPNICTIYDIGEHEGRPFIVMELLRGVTLRDRLIARPLKVHEAVDIGIQVADALFWAHSKDVIHRDIKPANLFLVDQGQVKILDFGLAKLIAPQPGAQETVAPTVDLTAVGVAVGTVAYMSPEQVSGEPLDRRTDLFSLGVVLYECVTGQQPFKGKTSAVILASILTQAPTAPVAINPEVPLRLQEVINNCLEKDRELRYQDAAGLRADLRRIKRDLESGALKTAAIAARETNLSNTSQSVQVRTTTADSAEPTRDVAAAPRRNRGLLVGGGVALVAIAGVILAVMTANRESPPAQEPAGLAVRGAPEPAADSAIDTALVRATLDLQARNYRGALAASEEVLRSAPGHAEATRIRDESRATLARFDAAVVEARQLLAAGDVNGASRAINTARDIDPTAPVVSELSSRLVEEFRAQADAARRASTDAARVQPPRRPTAGEPASPSRGEPAVSSRGGPPGITPAMPPPVPPPTPAPAPPPADAASASAPPVDAPPAAPRPAAVEPPPAASAPPPARAEETGEQRAPTGTTPTEDDDAAIRRTVATYARAIESKDLGLFRSVKPNLSAAEQRRIEEGFRAVTSQRVTISIVSIDLRGQNASVRLARRDVIQAGGRQQTADSQQTMTLTKTATGWVISEIGR